MLCELRSAIAVNGHSANSLNLYGARTPIASSLPAWHGAIIVGTTPLKDPPLESSVDGAQLRPVKVGNHWLDAIGAIAAILISVISLFVAIQNSQTEHQLVASSSWPFLREILSNEYDDHAEVALGVSNGGVGPAKIKTFELFYDGAPMASGLDLLRHCCGLGPSEADIRRQLPHGYQFSIVDDTVLRPGEDNVVFGVHPAPEEPEIPAQLIAHLNRVSFRACYCSVLDECWISNLQSTRVTPVNICAPAAHPYLPNGR